VSASVEVCLCIVWMVEFRRHKTQPRRAFS